jgi:hypothetical protein
MWRKYLLLPFITSLALPLTGCSPSQAEIENTVKKGMEDQLKIQVKSLTLTKQSSDYYTGTAEATNGDKYDVTVTVKGNQYEWKAFPDKTTLEKVVKKGMQDQLKVQVKSMTLNKGPGDNYSGTAETFTGARYDITVTIHGKDIQWKAQLSAPVPNKK